MLISLITIESIDYQESIKDKNIYGSISVIKFAVNLFLLLYSISWHFTIKPQSKVQCIAFINELVLLSRTLLHTKLKRNSPYNCFLTNNCKVKPYDNYFTISAALHKTNLRKLANCDLVLYY